MADFTTTPIATVHVSGTEGSNDGLVRSWGIQDSGEVGRNLIKAATPGEARLALETEDFTVGTNTILGGNGAGVLADRMPDLPGIVAAMPYSGTGAAATADLSIPYNTLQTSYRRVIDASLEITGVTDLPATAEDMPDAAMIVYLVHGAGGPFLVTWDATSFVNVGFLPLDIIQTPGTATGYVLLKPPAGDARVGVMKFPNGFLL